MTTVIDRPARMARHKFSDEFGSRFTEILLERKLSVQQASNATGGRISGSYIHHFKHGRIPSYDVLLVLREVFGAAQVDPLFGIAGYEAPPQVASEGGDLPPGARPIAPTQTRLPLGPPISAMRGDFPWDGPASETTPALPQWIDRGATMVVRVDGPCLEPEYRHGDLVALRPQDHAAHGDVVLARLSDGGYTLKRYVENGCPHLTTADPGKYPPPEGPFRIVAVVVGSAR